jgi:hypothetical protein
MVVPKLGVADGVLSQLFEQAYGHWPPATMSHGSPRRSDGRAEAPRGGRRARR